MYVDDNSQIERIEGRIDTNSIFTDNTIRDRDLRQKNFLNSPHFPSIVFVASGPIEVSDTSIKGKLIIKGHTKDVELPVKFQ